MLITYLLDLVRRWWTAIRETFTEDDTDHFYP